MQLLHVIAVRVEIRLFQRVFGGLMSGRDQRACRSPAASSLASSAPTSAPSGYLNSRFLVVVSSATLLALTRWLVCCIDRLNPPCKAVTQIRWRNVSLALWSSRIRGRGLVTSGSTLRRRALERLADPCPRAAGSCPIPTGHQKWVINIRWAAGSFPQNYLMLMGAEMRQSRIASLPTDAGPDHEHWTDWSRRWTY